MSPASKNASSRVASGFQSEALARHHLESQGYRILCANYRFRRGEIDLIALDQQTLCFIEVRSRTHSLCSPIETIGVAKQKSIARAAQHFLVHAWPHPLPVCRFDVVSVVHPGPIFTLVRDAFSV